MFSLFTNSITLQRFITEVTEYFKDDQTRASIITSRLGDGKWYLSVVRYTGHFATGKDVLCNNTHVNFDQCLKGLYKKWSQRRKLLYRKE